MKKSICSCHEKNIRNPRIDDNILASTKLSLMEESNIIVCVQQISRGMCKSYETTSEFNIRDLGSMIQDLKSRT